MSCTAIRILYNIPLRTRNIHLIRVIEMIYCGGKHFYMFYFFLPFRTLPINDLLRLRVLVYTRVYLYNIFIYNVYNFRPCTYIQYNVCTWRGCIVGIYAIIIMFSSILLYHSFIDFVYSDFFPDLLLLIY